MRLTCQLRVRCNQSECLWSRIGCYLVLNILFISLTQNILTRFQICSLYLFHVDFSIKSDRNMFQQEMQRRGECMKRSLTLKETEHQKWCCFQMSFGENSLFSERQKRSNHYNTAQFKFRLFAEQHLHHSCFNFGHYMNVHSGKIRLLTYRYFK